MYLLALKMLWGDPAKYLGLIAGIMFATLLMSQQVSIFTGIMARTGSQIDDVATADLWVMHPEVQYIEEIKPLPDKALLRVRSVEGVNWALPLFKGLAVARAKGGVLQQVIMMGVDDTTLAGQPPEILMGSWDSIRHGESLAMDRAGFYFFWPGEPLALGKELEINDQRAVVTAIVEASPPFLTFPVVYSSYSRAIQLSPSERNKMSFVIVDVADGSKIPEVQKRIAKDTGLQVLTPSEFKWRSIDYFMTRTGIAINFGTTVLLGFIIGAAVAGQTFYIFIIENIRQFGTLKALGVRNKQILSMVFLQAAISAFIGYSIGIGLCALFFSLSDHVIALRGFTLYWQIMAGTAAAIVVIIALASIASIRKVLTVDPALVFRG